MPCLNPGDQAPPADLQSQAADQDIYFSEHLSCSECHLSFPEIEPRTFSFNTPHGACPDCQGLGGKLEIDPDLLIPNKDLSIKEGAIDVTSWDGPRDEGGWYWQTLEAAARHYKIDLEAPVVDLPPKNWISSCMARGAKKFLCTTSIRVATSTPSSGFSKG